MSIKYSQNTTSPVTVISSLSASESCSRNAAADAALLCPSKCFICSQTHMWLKYVARLSNRNRRGIERDPHTEIQGSCHNDIRLSDAEDAEDTEDRATC